MEIQSLDFPRSWTPARAKGWARAHGFVARTVETTGARRRIRQRNPSLYRPGTFRTISLGPSVRGIVAKPKKASRRNPDLVVLFNPAPRRRT